MCVCVYARICAYMYAQYSVKTYVCMYVSVCRYVSHVIVLCHWWFSSRVRRCCPSCRLCQRYRAKLQRGCPLSSLASSIMLQSRIRQPLNFAGFSTGFARLPAILVVLHASHIQADASACKAPCAGPSTCIRSCDGKLLL